MDIVKQSEGLEYQIIDTENPQNNQRIPVADLHAGSDAMREQAREDAFQRVAHNVRIKMAEAINKRREAENKRALRTRVNARRKKERLAKASRKRNRG